MWVYKRFTPAGPDHAQIAACAGMADYIDELAAHHGGGDLAPRARAGLVHDLMRAHETRLLAPLLARLQDMARARNDLRLLGPDKAEARAPTVALASSKAGFELARALAGEGIMAGGGSFYADRALSAQGVAPARGVLRLSFVHYTSAAELDQLTGALDRLL